MVVLATACPIIPGETHGSILLSRRPLSLWGGIDPQTGEIIDHRHDRFGESVVGRVFVLPSEKGSSTGSAVLLELARIGKGPAAIITRYPSPILALGSIIARELYDVVLPVLRVSEDGFSSLSDGAAIHITADGNICSAE